MVPTPHPPSLTRITAGELVLVCSRYDLGAIRSLRRFRGGSRQSPKVLIESDRGLFLLKRRAPPAGGDEEAAAERIALAHRVQMTLGAGGFPVAEIIAPRQGRGGGGATLALNGFNYEVFGFIRGMRFDRSPAQARAAGSLLAVLHEWLRAAGLSTPVPGPPTYHDHPAAARTIAELPERLAARSGSPDPGLGAVCERLSVSYQVAARRAEELGRIGTLPTQLIHGDWHPGNLLFNPPPPSPALAPAPALTTTPAPPTIAAVLDFDAVRVGPTILDAANGAFQFAVSRRTEGPDAGRAGPTITLNPDRFAAFLDGYRIPAGLAPVLPWLMIEAMIVETVAPIAATGRFGKLPAAAALAMTARAAEWTGAESERLVSLAGGGAGA